MTEIGEEPDDAGETFLVECPECGAETVGGWVHTLTPLARVEAWPDGVVFLPAEIFDLPESVTIEIRCKCGWTAETDAWGMG
jgi:hypothetical protein